ncbi:MAG: Transcriptional regulator [Rhodobacteraceae bacterium HLUCCA12]|nr:MAG: Transcriptional regulator [Rhodobacteraceae bacterium HLUCCA12]
MIDKLEMFIALANERHFGRAAERHGVTQPTLSAAIRQLEGELGVQLVLRGARFQGLTPEGERVLDWARRIVTDSRQMRDEMRARRKGLSGSVRLGVIPTALPMVAGLASPFLKRHPNLRVQILSRTSVEILSEMESLQLDAGISYLDNEPLGRVTTVPLYREHYRLLVRADDPLAKADSLRWADLATVNLCLLVSTMQNRRIIDRYLAQAGVSVQAAVESNSLMALVGQVLSGGWATIITEQAARMFANRPDLVALTLSDGAAPGPEVGLITPWRATHTPVLAALIEAAERLRRNAPDGA